MKETPAEVLKRLKEGNARFVHGTLEHPNRCAESKEKSALGQSPSAIILGCSDSRVPVEIIFDQGLGDLFVIRVAGGVLGDLERESILFAVEMFGCPLIVALGHENCGAVQAMRDGKGDKVPTIARHLSPGVKTAATLEEAVNENVRHVVEKLKEMPVEVVGAVYELSSGKVNFLNGPASPQ